MKWKETKKNQIKKKNQKHTVSIQPTRFIVISHTHSHKMHSKAHKFKRIMQNTQSSSMLKQSEVNKSNNEKTHTHTEEERNNKLNVKYTCETKHGWENRVASENPCFLYTKYGLLCIWVFYPTDDGTHAPAIQPANNIHMPKKQPRDFGIFLLWILKWNFLQTHERLKRARRTPHYSTSAHSSSQIHPNKIWITVFGWHAALAIVINVSSVEAESRLMNDLLASARSNQIQLNVILQSD